MSRGCTITATNKNGSAFDMLSRKSLAAVIVPIAVIVSIHCAEKNGNHHSENRFACVQYATRPQVHCVNRKHTEKHEIGTYSSYQHSESKTFLRFAHFYLLANIPLIDHTFRRYFRCK